MKKLFILVSVTLFMSCNNTGSNESKETSATTPEEKVEYAYLPSDHAPDNWDRGSQKNLELVLKSLKAFETGDVEGSLSYFGDSVTWSTDNFDQKLSKDSLRAMLTGYRNSLASVKITMGDYESVISKDKKEEDKKEEWVTMWYKQVTTTKSGATDSIAVVDDAKIVNGKIVVLDEKSRKLPAKKK